PSCRTPSCDPRPLHSFPTRRSSDRFALLLAAIVGGGWIADTAWGAELFHLDRTTIAVGVIVYGFVAAVLPVWLLLAPRDYLSTLDRKSTRLNSSHVKISYAVFRLKK